MLLTSRATVQQRIVRAKRTLTAARVPLETPEPNEWSARLSAVLGVVYLTYTEGYAATRGDRWIRRELADEALRLGRVLAGLMPHEPEVHGLAIQRAKADALQPSNRSAPTPRCSTDGR